jgi:hypothetical protein
LGQLFETFTSCGASIQIDRVIIVLQIFPEIGFSAISFAQKLLEYSGIFTAK